MFKLGSISNTYKWPVDVEIPIDGGKFQKFRFTASFYRLSKQRFDEIRASVGSEANVDLALAQEIISDWGEDIKGDDGEPLPFTPEILHHVLYECPESMYIQKGIVRAFIQASNGEAPARKN